MDLKTKDRTFLRQYLLGELSAKEQEEVELWLMSDDDTSDLLEAVEDDLIDDSLAGRLGKRDLDRFNNQFLAAPERQRKLEFGRSFRRVIDAASPPAVASHSRLGLLEIIRHRPAMAYAGSGLIVVLMMASLWSLFRVTELQQRFGSATEQIAAVERDRDDLRRQLEQSQEALRAITEQMRALETAGAAGVAKISNVPVMLAVNLLPGVTRSSTELPELTLTASAGSVRFSLALLENNFPAYRPILMNADSREVWTGTNVGSTSTRGETAVIVTVPAAFLPSGEYSFNLMGIPDSGSPENAGRYHFRAKRQ